MFAADYHQLPRPTIESELINLQSRWRKCRLRGLDCVFVSRTPERSHCRRALVFVRRSSRQCRGATRSRHHLNEQTAIYMCTLAGPTFWGLMNPEWAMCNRGRRQSPINIEPSQLLFDPNLRPLHIDKNPVSLLSLGFFCSVTLKEMHS